MLVIVTLLGVAAVRATQVELKLSQNAESRMSAQQSAESMVAFVISDQNGINVPLNDNPSYVGCYFNKTPPPAMLTASGQGNCTAANLTIAVGNAQPFLQLYGYALVIREQPLFAEVNVLRDAMISARNYDFARYTVTGGYDRSGDGMSAAEVTEGLLVLHVKPVGLAYE
jgi:hypothetical protein